MLLRSKRFVTIAIWLGSVGAVAIIARAQERPVEVVPPFVVSGADLGFRVEGRRGNMPVGRVVIRKDANSPWIAVESAGPFGPRQLD